MSKPAARVGDLHACPAYNGKKPHVGGPIITGSSNVLIGGQPAARVGDQAVCTGGGIDTIVHGSSTVFVNGRPLALMGSLTANFQEWTLPGVHSDIGGGYLPKDKENLLVAPPVILQGLERGWPERSDAYPHLEPLRRQLEKEGWLGVHNQPPGRYYIEVERRNQPRGEGPVFLKLRLEREVRGEYSRIPLRLMHELACRQGVPFNDIDPTDSDWAIPHEREPVVHPLREHVLEGAPLQLTKQTESLLKQHYLHHSHHYGLQYTFQPHKPARQGRAIHPNHPGG